MPSTISSASEDATDGRTCRRPSMVLPIAMRSATEWLPSRMSWRRYGSENAGTNDAGYYLLKVISYQSLGSEGIRQVIWNELSGEAYCGLCMIQLHTPGKTPLGQQSQLRGDKFI